MRTVIVTLGALGLTLGTALAGEQGKPASPAIENGSKVKLEYTLKDEAGKVLETSKGRDPITYTQGENQIVPGLERALNGMRVGEQKTVTVSPEDGYGPVDPKAHVEVPRQSVPSESLSVGTAVHVQRPGGMPRVARVKEIKEKTVVLDLNHPLAGKTLQFDVKVMGVEPPQP